MKLYIKKMKICIFRQWTCFKISNLSMMKIRILKQFNMYWQYDILLKWMCIKYKKKMSLKFIYTEKKQFNKNKKNNVFVTTFFCGY